MRLVFRLVLLLAGVAVFPNCAEAQRRVTLQDFLGLVERGHPTLQAASLEPEQAQADLAAARGGFDPFLSVNYDSKLYPGDESSSAVNGTLSLPLDMMFGPRIKAGYSSYSFDSKNITTLPASASLGVSMPLLQGIFTDTRRNSLRKAELRPDVASAQFRLDRNALLRSAALRYIDWSEASELVDVADTLLALARRRQSFILRRSLSGESALIDSTEASQEVRRREGERLRSLRIAEQFGVDVKGFVFTAANTLAPDPFDSPTPLIGRVDSLRSPASAINLAFGARPELRRAELSLRAARLDSSLAAEFMRPNLLFDANVYGYSAITPNYSVGLSIQQPLFFRQASAGVQTTAIAVNRSEFALMVTQRIVEIDVRSALISLQRSLERRGIAEEEVRLALIMVNAEQTRFSSGDASLLTVNLRERFYGEALQRLVSAKADVERANIALLWAMGVI